MGRRHHRLRRTLGALALLAVVALVVGVWAYLRGRTQVRRPGEALDEITEKLSRNLPAEAPMPRLEDVTAAAGLASFRAFTGERSSQLPEDMGAGLAWGDFDNDGDDDLFVVGAGAALTAPADRRAPSELFENLGDGTFAPVADFPATRIQGMAAAWGDYDGDGWLDLVVTGYGDLLLFHNDRGRLTPDDALSDALDGPGGYWAGAVWGDFDGDRDLDLYVCGYVRYVEDSGQSRQVSRQYGAAVPYTLNPASFEPAANLLFENRSDGTFAEVAALWGVSNPEGRSLSALWHDFDQDGRLDLYVANDISDNALFLNRGDSFQDAGLTAWVADYRGAMGLAAGDFDRDGDDDLFVTHWLAQENALYDSRLVEFAAARAAGGTAPA
ncbi:MAG: VCBS repeat-containing protein, partial [Thermoanaerobaculia bacterium]|nr:VCBS repeat-containing protein [Thermoanaerobaculia bacterium]